MSVLSRLWPSSRFRTLNLSSRTREIASQQPLHPTRATSALRAIRDRFKLLVKTARPGTSFFETRASQGSSLTRLKIRPLPSSTLSNSACASEAGIGCGSSDVASLPSRTSHLGVGNPDDDRRSTLSSLSPSLYRCSCHVGCSDRSLSLSLSLSHPSKWSVPTLLDCPKAQPVCGLVAAMSAVGSTYI